MTDTTEIDWQTRVEDERAELTARLVKLRAFIEGEQYPSLSEEDQDDLLEQLTHMEGYEAVLSRRIGRFGGGYPAGYPELGG